MEFSRDLRDALMSGEVTVSFRLWRRPKVRTGGRVEFHLAVPASMLAPQTKCSPVRSPLTETPAVLDHKLGEHRAATWRQVKTGLSDTHGV